MEHATGFPPLLLVIILAFIVPLILRRFKKLQLPVVVGEILAGIIIGRSGFHLVQEGEPLLTFLAEIGFVFLMFLSGMEIDFSNLGTLNRRANQETEQGLSPLQAGLLIFFGTLILSTLTGFGLYVLDLVRSPWMMALILSTTSLGVVLPVLKEHGLSSGRYGQTLLIAALVADFATMLLITLLVTVLAEGLSLDILLVGLLFVATMILYRLADYIFNRLTILRRLMNELSHATTQIKVRGAFAIMLIFVVLSEFLGVEVILGAFLAGSVLALLRTPEDADLTMQLETIGFGFFIPIFFINVGINFNLGAILESSEYLALAPVLLVIALLVKFLPALLLARQFSWRQALAGGALLSSRLSLIIAASAIGLQIGAINEAMNAEIILIAVVTVTLGPLFFVRILPRQEEEPARLFIIAGGGVLGQEVARRLMAHGEQIHLVDYDPEAVERAQRAGIPASLGEIEKPTTELAGLLNMAQVLVSTHGETERSYAACHRARVDFGIDHVVAFVSQHSEVARFENLGALPINPTLSRGALISVLARNPAMYTLLTSLEDGKEVVETVLQNPQLAHKSLRELKLPDSVLIMALRRSGELIVPHGNTRLEPGDHITLVGAIQEVEEARHWIFSER